MKYGDIFLMDYPRTYMYLIFYMVSKKGLRIDPESWDFISG